MTQATEQQPNTLFLEVSGAGLPEVDGLYVPSGAAVETGIGHAVQRLLERQAGLGTMCELAEIQLGWAHLSTGDLLRAEL